MNYFIFWGMITIIIWQRHKYLKIKRKHERFTYLVVERVVDNPESIIDIAWNMFVKDKAA